MSFKKTSAIVSLGAGISQVPLIESARKKGYAVIAVDRDARAPGFLQADERVEVSTYDTKRVLEALALLRKGYELKGVIARASGRALFTASAIARRFRLPGMTGRLVALGTEKSMLRAWCAKNKLPAVRGVRAAAPAGVLKAKLRWPLIVKPDFTLVGKKAIARIKTPAELPGAFAAARKASGNGRVEVEEYIDGFDASCLFFLHGARAQVITFWDEMITVDARGRVHGRGARMPSAVIRTAAERKIRRIIFNFAKHLPGEHALLTISFRVDKRGDPYVMELHADLGGDDIAETLLPRANPEFDYFSLAVSVACGKTIPKTRAPFLPASISSTV